MTVNQGIECAKPVRDTRCESAARNVRCNTIRPGLMRTELAESMLTPETWAFMEGMTPMGRIGRVEEVAELATWLASDAARYVTGQAIAVDGGSGENINY